MGQAQRQEYSNEMAYGNGEPATSKINSAQREVLHLEDLVSDTFRFELRDPADLH